MICVSIGRGRHRHMIAEHKHLVDQGVKLVELRLDYIDRAVNLKRLIGERPCPTVVAIRRKEDGGKWAGTEDERQVLLRSAIAEGVEYIDLEEDVAARIPRFGKTKRIVSLHDFRRTPEDLDELHARLAAHDADIVKIAVLANQPHDNLRVLEMIRRAKTPTVAHCMGEIGTPSRILAGKFGAPFTYATFHHERALAPGQLSYKQMWDIYHYDQINAATEVFGVIADPVGHSFSPLIHNAAFRQMGMNRVYVPFRIPREHLESFLADCPALGVKGLSVTIPHKETIVRRLGKVDGVVRGIGAANTVVWEDGKSIGYNTDYRAAMESIDLALDATTDEKPFEGTIALILGAGGVSKAIAFGLKRRGADVVIASRSDDKAEALAAKLECRAIEWANRHQLKCDLLVNGTPAGMHPNVNESPFERRHLRPSTVVFDTVYNPEQTLLLKEAKQQSCRVISGVEMFIRQAAMQFKYFTGEDAPVEVMRDALRRAIGPAKY